jgi:hydroxyacylglutathione hydrolase
VKRLADGLFQLRGRPPNAFNVYLMGDVLVDSASRHARRRILRQVEGYTVNVHALTHAHADHIGSSHSVCEALGIPFWVGDADADAAESGDYLREMPDDPRPKFSNWAFRGPPHPVDRRLKEGDDVAGFTVLEVPGHSSGHVAYWREEDRALVLGDVLFNCHPVTGIPGLHESPDYFTPDPARNRESARRLAGLQPELVCFGHGPPLRDTRKLVKFVEGLTSRP